MIQYPYELHALKVEQPMGTYYVALMPAALLLDVCFSDRLRAFKEEGGPYRLEGTQRGIDEQRLKVIGGFISRSDAAFPNAVILAANSRSEDGFVEEEDAKRWSVRPIDGNGSYAITVPSKEKL